MTRRFWLRTCAHFTSVLAAWLVGHNASADQQIANLNETLRAVLRCRRPEEFAFVDSVAAKVKQGDLPKDMVISMMQWAKERRPEFPFPYFKEGIKLRAAKIGVQL